VLLLQLGERFNLPVINNKSTIFDSIKNIEKNLERFGNNGHSLRNEMIPILNNLCSPISQNNNTINKNLLK